MPRKTLAQRQQDLEKKVETKKGTEQDLFPVDTDDTKNRIRIVTQNLTGRENPDDIMLELLEVVQESGTTPEAGKFYIFVYNPKTSNIKYDQNPLVGVTDVFQWGFRGINFHWGQPRQYTWAEVAGSLHEVYRSELKDLQGLNFANFRINN